MTKLDTEFFFFFAVLSHTRSLSLSAELYGMTVTTEATNKKKKIQKAKCACTQVSATKCVQ